jgi:hypothetical protein
MSGLLHQPRTDLKLYFFMENRCSLLTTIQIQQHKKARKEQRKNEKSLKNLAFLLGLRHGCWLAAVGRSSRRRSQQQQFLVQRRRRCSSSRRRCSSSTEMQEHRAARCLWRVEMQQHAAADGRAVPVQRRSRLRRLPLPHPRWSQTHSSSTQ